MEDLSTHLKKVGLPQKLPHTLPAQGTVKKHTERIHDLNHSVRGISVVAHLVQVRRIQAAENLHAREELGSVLQFRRACGVKSHKAH